jgi:hypothetical protein
MELKNQNSKQKEAMMRRHIGILIFCSSKNEYAKTNCETNFVVEIVFKIQWKITNHREIADWYRKAVGKNIL